MSFDIKDKNGMYPFDIFDLEGISSSTIQLANSIKDVKIFVFTEDRLSGKLVSVSSSGIQFSIYKGSDSQPFTICTADLSTGRIQGGDIIDSTNSFVRFNEVPGIGIYNLPLLAETLCYIPKGLKLYCQSNQITRQAQKYSYALQKCYLYDNIIEFIRGKNCQIFTQDGVITFSGGAGNGLGRFTQDEMNRMWNVPVITAGKKQTAGLLSINGQFPAILIDASSGLNLNFATSTNVLDITIERGLQQ